MPHPFLIEPFLGPGQFGNCDFLPLLITLIIKRLPLTLQAVQRIKQIKELIEDSESKVKDGTVVVPKSGTALEDIVASVGSLTNLTGLISVASDEQAVGIEQINQALVNLDGMTQQNTSMVEAAAATSDAMSDQAEQLNRQIGYFRVA